jgi:uncharacterized membrane protein HdeD (DUF308 family)
MRDHWGILLAEGIIVTLLGMIAIFVPLFAGLVTTVFLESLQLVAGVVGLVSTCRAPDTRFRLIAALGARCSGRGRMAVAAPI